MKSILVLVLSSYLGLRVTPLGAGLEMLGLSLMFGYRGNVLSRSCLNALECHILHTCKGKGQINMNIK